MLRAAVQTIDAVVHTHDQPCCARSPSHHALPVSLHKRAQDNCIKVVMQPMHAPLVSRQAV